MQLLNIYKSINKHSIYFEIPLYGLIGLFSYYLIQKQILNGPDYLVHLNIIKPFIEGKFYIPHPGFHIMIYLFSILTGLSFINVTPFVMAVIITLTIFLTTLILKEITGIKQRNIELLFFSLIANIAIAVFVPVFSTYKYIGQWSPNIWHNPTITLLKPFALLGFLFVWKFTEYWHVRHGILASVLLLVGTIVKPSFIICLIPALLIYAVILKFNVTNFKKIFLIILPCILLLGYQFLETYLMKQTNSYFHDKVVFTWFGVLSFFTKNIFISLLLVLAFPLSILVWNIKTLKNKRLLLFTWILVIVSYLISGLLAEQRKFYLGAFVFSFVICLFILYTISVVEYVKMLYLKERKLFPILLSGFILACHTISGILYLYGLFIYGTNTYVA